MASRLIDGGLERARLNSESYQDMSLTFAVFVIFVACAAISVIILILRDARGRMSLRTMLFLVSLSALAIWALVTMIDGGE
jgi:hypothetical protein